ncbi:MULTISPECIES: hypothetical protein [unclassified Pseudomonas]|uniref:hypothetical protein n=1 Tax=unclassified Pseudomonas TaxID=196821 RepID=UPI00131E116D|nr:MULTISPECIES: hypothetical protein [unclassified Pseudomonas]
MKPSQLLFITFAALQLAGCAIGQKIDYRQTAPQLSVKADKPVAVAVLDERPYVVARNKDATYVGNIRGLYYNPWSVRTYSGSPLSADLQDAVQKALARSAITALPSQVSDRAPQGQKLLVLKLREWKSDAYMRVRFDYDVITQVLDDQGKLLASDEIKGSGPTNNVLLSGTQVLTNAIDAPAIAGALAKGNTP